MLIDKLCGNAHPLFLERTSTVNSV